MLQKQKELEEEMVSLGAKRYREKLLNAKQHNYESVTPAGLQFIRASTGKLREAIEDVKKQVYSGQPCKYQVEVVDYLTSLDSETIAFMVMKGCTNYLNSPVRLIKLATEVASFIEDELMLKSFQSQNPALFGVLKRDLHQRTSNYRKQKRVFTHSANKEGIEWESWPRSIKTRLGILLIQLVCDTTGFFEIKKHTLESQSRKTVYFVEATIKTIKWIEKKNSICELLSPIKMPCIIKPRPWTDMYTGGYHIYQGQNLVKTMDQGYLQDMENRHTELSAVFHAVNSVQETGWRINKDVHNIMISLFESQSSCSVIPEYHEETMSDPFPKGKPKEEIVSWKRRATLMHARNKRNRSKRIQFSQLMWMCKKFRDQKAFYFPHTIDFRGRLYASTAFLNPQGEDAARCLLEFSEGKPLGSSGLPWLKVHVANCHGYDKITLEERVDWVDQNLDAIYDVAKNPLINTTWMSVSKPWQYLRACIELWNASKLPNPEEYISHIPVTVDGSCNGLQHFAALLKDHSGGESVNISSGEHPKDIYQDVCDSAKVIMRDHECGPEDMEFRAIWETQLTRSLVKRPVMTTPYGATQYGMRQQIHEELKKQIEDGVEFYGIDKDDDLWPHCKYMAKVIYQAISEVVVSARIGMKWLQDIAKAKNKKGEYIQWTLPTGFVVKQNYYKVFTTQVKTIINGTSASVYMNKGSSGILNKARQVNGVAPNYIHSLDAAHLMMTVNSSVSQGIKDFAVVHDSFGTHACNIEELGSIIRETFIELYEPGDLLKKFRDEQRLSLTPLPDFGTLDINDVRDAEFFFS